MLPPYLYEYSSNLKQSIHHTSRGGKKKKKVLGPKAGELLEQYRNRHIFSP